MRQYINIAKDIYKGETFEEYWRVAVFVIRALIHDAKTKGLIKFFETEAVRGKLPLEYLYVYEQASRHWFYHNSKFSERVKLIEEHYYFLMSQFREEALQRIYLGESVVFWNDEYEGESIAIKLCFHDFHKKEGHLAIQLDLGEKRVYQGIFWIARNPDNEIALWIGALQGAPGGLNMNRALTKYFFGCRPQNLIIHVIQFFAHYLEIKRIYAVSNFGFFTKNHVRFDRKLKTSLDEIWQEIGGRACRDARFFELPDWGIRKDLDEIKSQKRSLYRKRFALLDLIDESTANSIETLLKK